MPLVQVKPKGQVTLPYKIRKKENIKVGDYLEIDAKHGKIILIPQVVINKFALMKLSKKGKKMIEEALKEVAKDKVKKFKDVEDLIKELHE